MTTWEIAPGGGCGRRPWGQSDMEAGKVREKLGPDKIIGVSCKNAEQALPCEKHGADYLGVGAIYPTGTKSDADAVTPGMLTRLSGSRYSGCCDLAD